MSMTKEEAIKWLEEIIQDTDTYWGSCSKALQKELDEQKQVFLLALSALRPITREQVEKVWRGCEKCNGAGEYSRYAENLTKILLAKYCPHCGRPLTDKAVDMVMERLEALRDE